MGDWEPGLDYSYNHNLLNDRDFLRIQTISPKIAYFPRPDLFTQLGYNLQFKDFHDDRDRDATTHQAALSQFVFFAEAKGYLLLGLNYDFEAAKEDRFDLEALTVSPALQLPLGWALTRLGSDGLAAAMPSATSARRACSGISHA